MKMNRNKYIVLVLFVIFGTIFSCKKNQIDETEDTKFKCSEKTFKVSFSDSIRPIDITEDNLGNTLILGDSNNIVQVIKLNQTGQILWKKYYSNFQGKAENILCFNDNSIVISTGLTEKQTIINNYNAYYFQGLVQDDITKNCIRSYQLKYGDDCFSYSGKSFLHKLNSDGDLIWTKEYEGGYTKGKTICKTNSDKILLLGYLNNGKVPELVIDQYGVFSDTINYALDKNKYFLYKIDKNGNTIWNKKFNNIYERSLDYQVNKNLVYTNDKIAISNESNILFLDHSGNEINRILPFDDYCSNRIISFDKAGNESFYISGVYFTFESEFLTNHKYFAKINADGSEIWRKETAGYITYINDNYVAIGIIPEIGSYTSFSNIIFDNLGNEVFTEHNLHCVSKNCCGGITAVKRITPDSLSVIRTLENGVIN